MWAKVEDQENKDDEKLRHEKRKMRVEASYGAKNGDVHQAELRSVESNITLRNETECKRRKSVAKHESDGNIRDEHQNDLVHSKSFLALPRGLFYWPKSLYYIFDSIFGVPTNKFVGIEYCCAPYYHYEHFPLL